MKLDVDAFDTRDPLTEAQLMDTRPDRPQWLKDAQAAVDRQIAQGSKLMPRVRVEDKR